MSSNLQTSPGTPRQQVSDRPPTEPVDQTRALRRTLQYDVLGPLTLLFVSPLIYMTTTAFKTTADAASPTPQWIPDQPTTAAFQETVFLVEPGRGIERRTC